MTLGFMKQDGASSRCSVFLYLLVAVVCGLLGAWITVRLFHLPIEVIDGGSVIWLLLLSPLVEEYVFRYLLLTEFVMRLGQLRWRDGFVTRSMTEVVANFLVALLFALVHSFHLGSFAMWFVLPSLLLGWVWLRCRNFVGVVAIHAIWNLALLLLS